MIGAAIDQTGLPSANDQTWLGMQHRIAAYKVRDHVRRFDYERSLNSHTPLRFNQERGCPRSNSSIACSNVYVARTANNRVIQAGEGSQLPRQTANLNVTTTAKVSVPRNHTITYQAQVPAALNRRLRMVQGQNVNALIPLNGQVSPRLR